MAEFDRRALERIISLYCDAWGEPDIDRRHDLLAQSCTDDAVYVDPNVHLAGRAALVEHIGKQLERLPASRIGRTSVADAHHDVVRFTWSLVIDGRPDLRKGIDFGELSSDGKLRRIVGFLDPLGAATS